MTDLVETRPASRRGQDRREAICDAVFELLGEVGYDRMTMDAIAARAHVSKATIYRTWTDKPELVAETFVRRFGQQPPIPDTGTLRGDLMDLMNLACQASNSPDGQVLVGVSTAAAQNRDLADTLHKYMYDTKRVIHATIIERAAARGEVDPDTDPELLHEVLFAMVFARRMNSCDQLDEQFARHVVDDVLLPVLAHRAR